jgi:NADPH:quinone reductase-like Zn-dependent oxidoreductase
MSDRVKEALVYHQHGEPSEVLRLENLPVPKIGEGEVLLRLRAAAIHPSDLGMIAGSYANLRPLPAVAGREGVGEVAEVGSGVDKGLIGRMAALPEDQGAWAESFVMPAKDLFFLPIGLPFEQAALALLNPMTAWRLLHDFEYLKPGDWIIQNAANSAVGLAVIQLARHLGVRTVNVVRREELRDDLRKIGADVVVLDDEDYPGNLGDLTGGKDPKLALNSIGGPSALRLAKTLDHGGVHVTFGAMTGESIRFPTRRLIFDDVRFVGFWLDQWKRRQSHEKIREVCDEILFLAATNVFQSRIEASYPLVKHKEALAHSRAPRLGKVIFADVSSST